MRAGGSPLPAGPALAPQDQRAAACSPGEGQLIELKISCNLVRSETVTVCPGGLRLMESALPGPLPRPLELERLLSRTDCLCICEGASSGSLFPVPLARSCICHFLSRSVVPFAYGKGQGKRTLSCVTSSVSHSVRRLYDIYPRSLVRSISN